MRTITRAAILFFILATAAATASAAPNATDTGSARNTYSNVYSSSADASGVYGQTTAGSGGKGGFSPMNMLAIAGGFGVFAGIVLFALNGMRKTAR